MSTFRDMKSLSIYSLWIILKYRTVIVTLWVQTIYLTFSAKTVSLWINCTCYYSGCQGPSCGWQRIIKDYPMKEAGPELQLCEKRCTTQQTRFQEDLCFLITQNEQTFPVFPSTFISGLLLKPPLRKASDADHHCSSTSKLVIFKEFTTLKPNFSYFCWSYSTCNYNDMLFHKRIGTGSSIHYKSMPRMRQEGEGSLFLHMQFFLWLKHVQLDYTWTQKIFEKFPLWQSFMFWPRKKKPTLCLLLPAPFLSNGLLCWRM